jgi:cytochrome P450
MARTPPGPRSLLPGRLLRTLQRDPIPLFTRLARDYGDASMFSVLGQKIVFFNHPDLVAELLVAQNRFFHKSRVLQRSKIVFGEGLLTSEDPLHLRQRRLAQPAFHRERIARYAEAMVACAARTRERWRDGETLDVHHEMMRLTLDVVAKTLFGADVGGEADEIGAALTQLVDLFPLLMNPVAPLLQKLPIVPSTRRFRRAVSRLDETIYAMIEARRRSNEDRGDLLSMLLLAQDVEGDGGGMTDRQLRDEAMTLFLAGHETTANALAWTWYLLGLHPDVAEALHAHVADVLGDRLPTADDYPRLHFAEAVLAESMRLFPPAWAVSRLAMQDVTIGEWLVPRGAVAVVAQAVMHRDARFWPEPERFDPSRFTEAKTGRPKFAYFPFGGGPRICIGEGFAWMEGVLLLATLAQRWRMELLSRDVAAQASITLRPRGGIAVRLRHRV